MSKSSKRRAQMPQIPEGSRIERFKISITREDGSDVEFLYFDLVTDDLTSTRSQLVRGVVKKLSQEDSDFNSVYTVYNEVVLAYPGVAPLPFLIKELRELSDDDDEFTRLSEIAEIMVKSAPDGEYLSLLTTERS